MTRNYVAAEHRAYHDDDNDDDDDAGVHGISAKVRQREIATGERGGIDANFRESSEKRLSFVLPVVVRGWLVIRYGTRLR